MKVPRRQFLYLAAVATTLPALSRFASAQSYPTRQCACSKALVLVVHLTSSRD